MRSVIIISPYFPPASLAGVHRARLLVKHLPAVGWKPTVICVHEKYYTGSIDPNLAELLPSNAQVVKTGAIQAALARKVGLGDIGLRGFLFLRAALLDLIEHRRPDVVLITGSPYYPMLFSGMLRRREIPVVLDFQDPWVSNWGAQARFWSKAGMAHRLAIALEPSAVRAASFITSVSEAQNEEMIARYRWLDRDRMAAIPIGGDPEDFAHVRFLEVPVPKDVFDSNRINLSFVGTFMPRSGPLTSVILRALARLKIHEPALASRIRLNFVGTSNQPEKGALQRVMPLAREAGVADAVYELPERLPFLQALAILSRSDGLLLIGSDEPHYTASKIYPALMSGRPYLSLFHKDSSSHTILTAAGGGLAFSWGEQSEDDLLIEVTKGLTLLASSPSSLGRADPSCYTAYDARSIAKHFARIFDAIQ